MLLLLLPLLLLQVLPSCPLLAPLFPKVLVLLLDVGLLQILRPPLRCARVAAVAAVAYICPPLLLLLLLLLRLLLLVCLLLCLRLGTLVCVLH